VNWVINVPAQVGYPPHISLGSMLQISSTPNFIVQCAWLQAACNPRSSHGCQCSAMLHLLLYAVNRQLTICFKSSKPIQIGLCMLMSSSIHLHGLHLDAKHGQTWHLSTQLRSGERASVVNYTIVTDPTIRQPGFDLPRHTWSPMNRFRAGKGPCRANLHKWGLAPSPSCDCGQPQTMNHIVDTCLMPINKIWRWTESTPRSGWRRRHMAGIYSDCSTRDINKQINKVTHHKCLAICLLYMYLVILFLFYSDLHLRFDSCY